MTTSTERWPVKSHDCAMDDKLVSALTEARRRSPMKQYEAAERIGISPAALSMWEAHIHGPDRLSKWQAWARALGCELVIELRDRNGNPVDLSRYY